MVSQFIKPGTNVLELGGSLGIVSASIRRAIGPHAFHLIVEANTALLDICRSNASIGAQPGTVEVMNAAIDYSGKAQVRFCSSPDALGGHLASQSESGQPVKATTFRELADRMPSKPFALVCDIEGAEFELFQHDVDALSDVSLVIVETHPTRHCDGPRAVERTVAALEDAGFKRMSAEDNVLTFSRAAL
jgi:FkbM family methyltransferase